jgi:hypothetical protein
MSGAAVEGQRARRLALAVVMVSGVVLALYFELWHCPIAALFGVPCPGCGLTRAAAALLAFDLVRAFGSSPVSPLVLPWAAVAATDALIRFVRGAPPRAPGRRPMAVLLLTLLIGVWVARFFGAFGGPVRVASHLGL